VDFAVISQNLSLGGEQIARVIVMAIVSLYKTSGMNVSSDLSGHFPKSVHGGPVLILSLRDILIKAHEPDVPEFWEDNKVYGPHFKNIFYRSLEGFILISLHHSHLNGCHTHAFLPFSDSL
jgi:hypothetical protein